MSYLVLAGLEIMLIGMGAVFFFLALLVFFSIMMSRFEKKPGMTLQKMLFLSFVLNTGLFLLLAILANFTGMEAFMTEISVLSLIGLSLNLSLSLAFLKKAKSEYDPTSPDERSQEEIMSDLDQEVSRRREIAKLEKN